MTKPNPFAMNGEILALSLLTVGEVAHSFSSFMPSSFTARNWVLNGSPDEIRAKVADWRSGYRPALAFGLGLGAAVAAIARSPMPLLFAGAAAVAMSSMYEHVLPPDLRLSLDQWPALLLTGTADPKAISSLPRPCGCSQTGALTIAAPGSGTGL